MDCRPERWAALSLPTARWAARAEGAGPPSWPVGPEQSNAGGVRVFSQVTTERCTGLGTAWNERAPAPPAATLRPSRAVRSEQHGSVRPVPEGVSAVQICSSVSVGPSTDLLAPPVSLHCLQRCLAAASNLFKCNSLSTACLFLRRGTWPNTGRQYGSVSLLSP